MERKLWSVNYSSLWLSSFPVSCFRKCCGPSLNWKRPQGNVSVFICFWYHCNSSLWRLWKISWKFQNLVEQKSLYIDPCIKALKNSSISNPVLQHPPFCLRCLCVSLPDSDRELVWSGSEYAFSYKWISLGWVESLFLKSMLFGRI